MPATVDRAGVQPVICEQKDCVRRLVETGISDQGWGKEGGHTGALVSGLSNYSTHVRTIQLPCPPPREQHAVCPPQCFCSRDSHHGSQLTVSCCCAINVLNADRKVL